MLNFGVKLQKKLGSVIILGRRKREVYEKK